MLDLLILHLNCYCSDVFRCESRINHRQVIKGKCVCIFFLINKRFCVNYYLVSNFCSYSSLFKDVKSLFHRYFSFSNKVFYPVAYIMNGLQHLTNPTSLKFCLALCFSCGPDSSKFGPSCPQVGPNFFSFGEKDGDNFFRARANPGFKWNIF